MSVIDAAKYWIWQTNHSGGAMSRGGTRSASKRKKSNLSMGLTLGVALGLIAGTALWAATNSIVVGLGAGLLMGLLVGWGIGKLFDAEDPRTKSRKGAGSKHRRLSSGRQ